MTYKVTAASNLNELRLNETDTVKSVIQNIIVILNTWKGSVPLYRDFGISDKFMHRPFPAAQSMLCSEIQEAVEKYESRAEVVKITFSVDGKNKKLVPTVEVKIRNEQKH